MKINWDKKINYNRYLGSVVRRPIGANSGLILVRVSFIFVHKHFLKYSRLPIIRTFKENRKKLELSGVRVIEGKIMWKMIWREMKITSS